MFGEANVRRIKNGLKLEERTRRLGGKGDGGVVGGGGRTWPAAGCGRREGGRQYY